MQANWPLERSLDEVVWVHDQHEETGWPDAIVGSADLFDPQAGATLEAQAKATPLMRGCRLQLHWHENPQYRFAKSADAMLDPVFNENLELLAELGWVFELQVFPNQLAVRDASWSARHPDLHVRAHPRRDADRGRAVARAAGRAGRVPEPVA